MAEQLNTATFQRKNNLKIILITLLIITVLAIVAWLLIWRTPADKTIKAGLSSTAINVGQDVHYGDSSKFANEWLWNFDDGVSTGYRSGWHRYEKAGNYTVRLTLNNDNRYRAMFSVVVSDTTPIVQVRDSVRIVGPKRAIPGYIVEFQAKGVDKQICTWFFGDGNNIEQKGPPTMPHAYKDPGKYTVYVYTDDKRYAMHTILISEPFDSLKAAARKAKQEDDFKYHLQQIANHGDFNEHYYYLLNKYLCTDNEALMKVNSDKNLSFYRYCRELYLDKDVQVQSAKIAFGKPECVTSVEVITTKI